MPTFGGFNTGNIGGALGRNILGSVANAVLPRTTFGGFGLPQVPNLLFPSQNSQDRMVSLRPKPGAANRVYGSGLLRPLKETGGLIWPYTPSISYPHGITYEAIAVTHANQDFHVYSKTPAVPITVSGEFTVQNQQEGAYALAALHFLRTMAKMHFGESDPQAGTPPPVLLFNAYGPFVFKDVPVIVREFTVDFPQDVDYVQINVVGTSGTSSRTQGLINEGTQLRELVRSGAIRNFTSAQVEATTNRIQQITRDLNATSILGTSQTYQVWLPAVFKISCSIIVQHSPQELRTRFNLPKYINGDASQKDFV